MTDRSAQSASPRIVRNQVPGRRKPRHVGPALAGLLVAIGAIVPVGGAAAQGATGSAPAGDTPTGKYTTTAYVVSSETGTVTPIDTQNGTAESPITVGRGADAMAIAPNGRTGYVTVSGGVVPIDLLSNIPGQLIPFPGGPGSIAITPDSSAALVGTLDGRLYRISLSSGTVATPVTLPAKAVSIAITPDGRTAYMATNVHAHELRVMVYDIATNTVLSSIQEPDGAMALAVAPNGTTAYVANFLSKVTPLSTATNALGPPINNVGLAGSLYKAIAITPDGQKLYRSGEFRPVGHSDRHFDEHAGSANSSGSESSRRRGHMGRNDGARGEQRRRHRDPDKHRNRAAGDSYQGSCGTRGCGNPSGEDPPWQCALRRSGCPHAGPQHHRKRTFGRRWPHFPGPELHLFVAGAAGVPDVERAGRDYWPQYEACLQGRVQKRHGRHETR